MLNLFETMNISASGMTAQRARLDVIASNIANAETTRGHDNEPYRRKTVLFSEIIQNELLAPESAQSGMNLGGVRIVRIEEDQRPFRLVFDPSHPDADDTGYVQMPNVNVLKEMIDLINAQRSYEANASVVSATKAFATAALQIRGGG